MMDFDAMTHDELDVLAHEWGVDPYPDYGTKAEKVAALRLFEGEPEVPAEEPDPEPAEVTLERALVVMHATTTLGRAGEELWVDVDDRLARRAAKGLLTVLRVEPMGS